MQVVRLIVWIAITAIVVFFISMNLGQKVPVRFWPLDNGDRLLFEWPVGVIALVFFLLGFLPMWLVHKGTRWRLSRRISSLENATRANSVARSEHVAETSPPHAAPSHATATQSEVSPGMRHGDDTALTSDDTPRS